MRGPFLKLVLGMVWIRRLQPIAIVSLPDDRIDRPSILLAEEERVILWPMIRCGNTSTCGEQHAGDDFIRRYRGAALFFAAILTAVQLAPAQAAIFNIEYERESVAELRSKDPGLLSHDEREILRVADSYGNVGFCGGASGGNGLLVRFNGRPAVVTSAHMLIDSSTGELKCSQEDFRGSFMPNVSYFEPDNAQEDQEFVKRRVDLVYPPVNIKPYLEAARTGNTAAKVSRDWLVFFLAEDITTDIMPGDHERGFIEYSPSRGSFDTGQLYLIGVHKDLDEGLVTHYQRCDYANLMNLSIQHVCDTLPGTSGSMLLTMEDDELRLYGLHAAGQENDDGSQFFDSPPQDRSRWNSATPALRVFEAQDPEFQRLP